jgi:hypothetical protein
MAIMIKNDQFLYAGRGPVDAKALVKTYAELTDLTTWTEDIDGVSTFVAYNGMLVAVWLNKEDTSKNGLYFLFDSAVTTAAKKPNVADSNNWHKLAEMSGLVDFTGRLSTIESELENLDVRLTALEDEEPDVLSYGYRNLFPNEGVEGKLYVAVDEQKSYVWVDTIGYLCVGEQNEEPDVIYGGSAD